MFLHKLIKNRAVIRPVYSMTVRSFCKEIESKDNTVACDGQQSKTPQEDEKTILKLKDNASDNDIQRAAKQKLLSLLSGMTSSDDALPSNKDAVANLAKPQKRIGLPKIPKKVESETEASDVAIASAIKSVASVAGENANLIEQDLTSRVKEMSLISDTSDEEDVVSDDSSSSSDDSELVEEELNQHMMTSVKDVADVVSGKSPEDQIQSELTKKLLNLQSHSVDSQSKNMLNASIESLFQGMIIDAPDAAQKRMPERRKSYSQEKTTSSRRSSVLNHVDLVFASPLNIFTSASKKEGTSQENIDQLIWPKLESHALESLVRFSPSNAIEEMIDWTNKGKHWTFPIDNELAMVHEENVGFHEHVFLQRHLKGFPVKGPIRHFMELVITGLSKNPYITVERKIENIEWMRNYFKEKEDILKEYNVLD